MNYKITCHLMPWELDYALLTFIQLKKSKYYLSSEDNVYIDITLNLSSYIFNWESSRIPKEFFIDKFNHLKVLLEDYTCRYKIYDGDALFGGLDTQREATEDFIDYYIIINPDTYFKEEALYYLIESSKLIKNKYFVINQQIPKLWDASWDEISHEHYRELDYSKWHEIGVFDVRHFSKQQKDGIELVSINYPKWAGWMDLYSKDMWEDFWVHHEDWNGYGACDIYTIGLAYYAKRHNMDFKQYMLKNQLVYPYWANKGLVGFTQYYKDMLSLNDIPNQRDQFDLKMKDYLIKGVQHLLAKNKK